MKFKRSIMRISLTLCLITSTLVYATAEISNAQVVSLNKRNATLYEVIDEIRNQTGYDFFVDHALLRKSRPVNVTLRNAPIVEALERCFENQPLSFEIRESTVIIKQKKPSVFERLSGAVDMSGSEDTLQEIQVGFVADTAKRPLAGVSVSVKGTTVRTTTDANGRFQLIVERYPMTLAFSFVGMEPKEITLHGKETAPVRVQLHATTLEIDNVVVTGYSTIRKESFTGNAIQLDREDILKVGNRNILDVLQVYDPSFRLERNNLMGSDPNTLPEFYIRGRSGIGVKELDQPDLSEAALTNNPNLPVFIMDGYEVTAERVYDFDPMQLKSVTILKDAAATAVYGSRAANGVIVIETIPPLPGRIRLNYNLTTSVTAPDLSSYNLMNASEKLEAERLAGHFSAEPNTAAAMSAMREYLAKQNQLLRGVNTDWLSMPLRNEFNQKHTLTAQGGSEQLRFNAVLRYDNQNGVMKGSKRDRMGGTVGLEYRHRNFQLRNETWYDVTDGVNSPYGEFSAFAAKLPYDHTKDEFGNILSNTTQWHSLASLPYLRMNPLYEAEVVSNTNTTRSSTILNNLALNWQVIPHLSVRGQLSLTKTGSELEQFTDPLSGRYWINRNTMYDEVGELLIGSTDQTRVNTNLVANYFRFIGNHQLNFAVGVNAQETNQRTERTTYKGFASAQQRSPNFASQVWGRPAYRDSKSRLFGSFATVNYSYRDIYLLDLSSRIDGSSEFGTNRKWAPFWSAGAGINFHRYAFMERQGILTRARVTAVLGQLGKTNFQPYAAQHMYRRLGQWYLTGPGSELIYLGNENLRWEITHTTDVIVDLGLWKDRVGLNLNWYNRLTDNLVNDVDLPLSSGFPAYKDNIGQIRNRGVEIMLRADIVKTKDILVSPWINFAANRNVLLELSNALQRYNDLVNARYNSYNAYGNSADSVARYATPRVKYTEGTSITSVYGMQSLGIDPADGREVFLRPDGTITYDWNAGDQVIIGDTSPKGQGAFGLNMNYKGFTFAISLLYQFGGQAYNSTLVSKVENVNLRDHNADRRVLTSRWQQPGDIAMFKDIAESAWTTRPTSRFMQNLNELSINSLSMGYTFDQQAVGRWGLSLLRIQANTNNVGVLSSVRQERGLSYPYARTFDLSLNVGF